MKRIKKAGLGSGKPSVSYLFSYVFSELLQKRLYTGLACFGIAIALIYYVYAIYYCWGIYQHRESLTSESMDTKIIVNVDSLANTSTWFGNDEFKEFLTDPRIVQACGKLELGIKLSKDSTKPIHVSAEGVLIDDVTTSDFMLVCGRGISSLSAREVVISEALYHKFWGAGNPQVPKILTLSLIRVNGYSEEQPISLNLDVVGILKSEGWNRVYLPLDFLSDLNYWCDGTIESLSKDGFSSNSEVSKPKYKSGLLYVNSKTSKTKLDSLFAEQEIIATKTPEVIKEIKSNTGDDIRFSLKPTLSDKFSDSQVTLISELIPEKSFIEKRYLKNLDVYFGKSVVNAKVLCISDFDNLDLILKKGLIKDGLRLSEVLDKGILISKSFEKQLESYGKVPRVLHCGTSSISNSLKIAGIISDNLFSGDWDILCNDLSLSLATLDLGDVTKECLVHTYNPTCLYSSTILDFLDKQNASISRTNILDVFYPNDSDNFMENIFNSTSGLEMKIPQGAYPIHYRKEYFSGYSGLWDVLYVPEDILSDILDLQGIDGSKKSAVIITSDKQIRDSIELYRVAKRIVKDSKQIGFLEGNEGSPFLMLSSLNLKKLNSARNFPVCVGFVCSKDILEQQNYDVVSFKLNQFSCFFSFKGERKVCKKVLEDNFLNIYQMAEIFYLPKLQVNGLRLATSTDSEISKLPFKWASSFGTLDFVYGSNSAMSSIQINNSKFMVNHIDDESFPLDLLLIPSELIRNNLNVIDPKKYPVNEIVIRSNLEDCKNVDKLIKTLPFLQSICLSELRSRTLDVYEFTDARNPEYLDSELIGILKSLKPTVCFVKPKITVDTTSINNDDNKYSLVGSSSSDIRRLGNGLIYGQWLNDENGILLPLSFFDGKAIVPENVVGRVVEVIFERTVKRSRDEPALKINFNIDGIVDGDVGYLDLKRANGVFLWKMNEVIWSEDHKRFMSPSEIFKERTFTQCKLFVKDLDSIAPVVAELQAEGYKTYDSLIKQESLRKLSRILKLIIVFLIFGVVVSGIVEVFVITLMGKESRIHETGNLLAFGASWAVIRKMFIFNAVILAFGAYIIGMFIAIIFEPYLTSLFGSAFDIDFNNILKGGLFSYYYWDLYLTSFIVSVICCLLAVGIVYIRIRGLTVIDILRKQYH